VHASQPGLDYDMYTRSAVLTWSAAKNDFPSEKREQLSGLSSMSYRGLKELVATPILGCSTGARGWSILCERPGARVVNVPH
jgi:hypothetical protein